MTKTTKILLTISLIAFAIGCTDFFFGVGKPVGAIFFGLFLISKLLEKEVALYHQEERERFERAQRFVVSKKSKSSEAPGVHSALSAAAHS